MSRGIPKQILVGNRGKKLGVIPDSNPEATHVDEYWMETRKKIHENGGRHRSQNFRKKISNGSSDSWVPFRKTRKKNH